MLINILLTASGLSNYIPTWKLKVLEVLL